MLSVTSATVHQTMCPSTPKPNSTPTRLGRKDRWNKCHTFSKHIYKRNSSKNDIPIYMDNESLTDVPNQLKNVSLNVVAATTSGARGREVSSIAFTVKENVWAKNNDNDDDDDIVANDIIENEELWICEEKVISLPAAVVDNDDTSDQDGNLTTKETVVERKRKRGMQSRLENAAKHLKKVDSVSMTSLPDTNQLNTISDVSNNDSTNDDLLPVHNEENDTWNTKDEEQNWEDIWHTDNNICPYYMTGFPNPPGENRCWLNATLQALFILPLINFLDRIDLNQSSRLTKTLVAMQQYWKKGTAERETTYQIVKKFKEELAILDETYPSQKQQDVSEFLMIFLNYIKTECEQLAMVSKSTLRMGNEAENIPENGQDIFNNVSRVQTTPKKRAPLAALSPIKQVNNVTETIDKSVVDVPSLKNLELEPIETTAETTTINPIDDFFLLHMSEHYMCKGCSEHRQRSIDNLMLYVDIPDKEAEVIDLKEAIDKSMEPEERSLTCAKCKHAKHDVSTTFRRSPTVLIVQINRYGMTNEGIVEKINTAVNIPEELTLKNDDDDEDNYRFKPVSIVAHVGSAMDCGHYTSYAVHNDQWVHYNDMDVVPMSKDEALTAAQSTAYLVFFVNVEFYSKYSNMLDTAENPLR